MDLAAYRAEAEEFLSSIDREYYLHYSGQQDEFEIEPIYDRHAALFAREAVDGLREAGAPAPLIEFAVQGLIGRETKEGVAELARREAALELEWDGAPMPYPLRRGGSGQRARPGPPRASWKTARNALLAERAEPALARAAGPLPRAHPRARVAVHAGHVRGASGDTDLGALARADGATSSSARRRATRTRVEPELRSAAGAGLRSSCRRADLTAFFRAPALDADFPERPAGAVAHRDAGRDGNRRGRAARGHDRHRAPAQEVAARVLLARAGARRGVPGDRPGRRPRGLRRAVPRGGPHRALRARGSPRCRWRRATWATTRSRRGSRSCSSTWCPTRSGCGDGWGSRTRRPS